MSRSLRVLASLSTLVVLLGSVPLVGAAGPTREVVDLDDPAIDAEESAAYTEACGFPVAADNDGHMMFLTFPDDRQRVQMLNLYAIRATYTNLDTGASIRLRDAGPDRVYSQDGKVYVAVTGRSTTGTGVIGQTVFDLETFDVVKQVGNDVGLFQDQLCAALSS